MKKLLVILLITALIFGVYNYLYILHSNERIIDTNGSNPSQGKINVHFIDVGQADCILVQSPEGRNLLIDAGNNTDGKMIVDYLHKHSVKKIDFVVATHPHEDHIGGMDTVINSFEIGNVYMPKVTSTTKTYRDVVNAIKKKKITVKAPVTGSNFSLGNALFTILAPGSEKYEDINNYSIALKMQYGNTSYLFAADAQDVSENEMLNSKLDLEANVLKVGHHGSNTSTTDRFLDKVNPKAAVIMCGLDNDFGHPHKPTVDKLKAIKIPLYRTDESSTIISTSDGTNITFNVEPGSYKAGKKGSK